MRLARVSGIPGRRVRAAVLDDIFPRYVFIPQLIIFAAACLLLAGCTNEYVVAPDDDNGNGTDDPVCSDSLPSVEILIPPADAPKTYPVGVQFTWRTPDEGSIAATRYLLTWVEQGVDAVAILNDNPEAFEDLWSDWKIGAREFSTLQPGEDDEYIGSGGFYLFAVQLIDSCGRVTTNFSHERNARQFRAQWRVPTLTVMEPKLGSALFRYTWVRPEPVFVPAGVPLTFMWEAPNTFDWLSPILYRCGWDIQNLDDDEEWDSVWSPFVKQSSERSFNSGIHVFYVEARDATGEVTRARIEIEIMPFQMDRDLLWVDDWSLGETFLPNMMLPHEEAHDEFWTGICSRAPGFDPMIDIYPADELYASIGDAPLPLETLFRYKHVIWTYSNSAVNVWKNTIRFQSLPIGFRGNTLALYLAAGGSVLTCGRSDLNASALGSTFQFTPDMPASILDDYISDGFVVNDQGRYSMAWNDYYVTVVDKVIGHFKVGEELMNGFVRRLDNDAFRSAYLNSGITGDLPETLDLWEEVTQPGMFFDRMVRGFYYVEAYDPEYYMNFRGLSSHDCFSPLYRMRARSTRSPLDHAAVALKVMRPECENTDDVIYDSYHFGIPLWFMDHGQVEQITDYIFEQWEIR